MGCAADMWSSQSWLTAWWCTGCTLAWGGAGRWWCLQVQECWHTSDNICLEEFNLQVLESIFYSISSFNSSYWSGSVYMWQICLTVCQPSFPSTRRDLQSKVLHIIPWPRQTSPHIIYWWLGEDVRYHLAKTKTKTNSKTNSVSKAQCIIYLLKTEFLRRQNMLSPHKKYCNKMFHPNVFQWKCSTQIFYLDHH